MKETLGLISKIIGWIALFAAFGALGFATDNPKIGVPAYLIFFLIVFGVIYLYISKKKGERQEISPKTIAIAHKIIGILLILFALLVPDLILGSYKFPIAIYMFISVLTFVLIIVGAFTVKLINNNLGKNGFMVFLGYLIFIVLSAVPAVLMLKYDSSYNALGLAYWSALSITIFGWWGISLYSKHVDVEEPEQEE